MIKHLVLDPNWFTINKKTIIVSDYFLQIVYTFVNILVQKKKKNAQNDTWSINA